MASAASESKIVIKAQDDVSAAVDRIHGKLLTMGGPMGEITRKLATVGSLAKPKVTELGDSFANLSSKLNNAGLGIGLGMAGVAFSAAGAFAAVKETAAKADRIDDIGGRLQLNAEQFQVFEKLAKDSGASIEEVGGAFMKFRLNLQQAESEGGEKLAKIQKALRVFGLSYDEARKMPPLELAKKLGQISADSGTDKDGELKIPAFKDLFGRSGATLIPVFEAVGTSYNKTVASMNAAGTLFRDSQIKIGSEAYKRYEKAQAGMSGLMQTFGMEMMGPFARFSDTLYSKVVDQRKTLLPTIQALANDLTESIDPLLDSFEKLAKGSGETFKKVVKLTNELGVGNVAMAAGVLAAAPFIASLLDIGKTAGIAAYKMWTLVAVPFGQWLATTQAGMWGLNIAAGATWATVFLPLAIGAAAVALLAVNINEIGTYLQGVTKRVTEATDKGGVFLGIWQMLKEIAFGAINSIIGGLNTLSNLLAKMGIFDTGGELKLVGEGIEGQGDRLAAKRIAEQSAGGLGGIPATSIATGRQEVNGTVRVQLDKGLVPVDVKSDNKSFNIDALSGPMYATGA